MNLYKNKKAFTLVELIVVITILAILGTIAFMSFQGYSRSARDSVRISDIQKIEKQLEIMLVSAGVLPIPENKVSITASGIILSYQGNAGENVLGVIGVSSSAVDPLDEESYTYVTDKSLNKYQIMGYLENGDYTLSSTKVHAGLENRFPYTKGNNLGVVIDQFTSQPIQKNEVDVDIVNTNNNYQLILSNQSDDKITGTGGVLFSKIYHANGDWLTNKQLAKYDNSLLAYWDMETVFNSGGTIYLSDLSQYDHYGECYDTMEYTTGTLVNCGGSALGPHSVSGKVGEAMNFDGVDDVIKINNSSVLDLSTQFSIYLLIKPDSANPVYNSNLFRRGTGEAYSIGFGTGSYFRMRLVETPGINEVVIEGDQVSLDDYYTVIGIYDGENATLHTNYGSTSTGAVLNVRDAQGTKNLVLGNYHSTSYNGGGMGFDGVIDEARVYNRVLSNSEVIELLKIGK